MPKINKEYATLLREKITNQALVDELISHAPVNETPEQRKERLKGMYAAYYTERLEELVGKYYRNESQMTEEQKKVYQKPLDLLKEDIRKCRDDLLTFYLIAPILVPNDETRRELILQKMHEIYQREHASANQVIKAAIHQGEPMKEYFEHLVDAQQEIIAVAIQNGGSFYWMNQSLEDADPYQELLYR